MAHDNLDQVGKYVKKTREDADYALSRYQQRRARIERARDTFSSDLSFVMYFDIEQDETVSMEINFNKPPPGTNFGIGTCEEFTVGTTDSILTTSAPYVTGSLGVFMNDVELTTTQWYEYEVSAHQVFVKGGIFVVNTVVICYERV